MTQINVASQSFMLPSNLAIVFQGNFSQIPASFQQMGGFQLGQPHGVQGFGPHQGQVRYHNCKYFNTATLIFGIRKNPGLRILNCLKI